MIKFLPTLIIIFFWKNSCAQTIPFIAEIRTDFGIENLDIRLRPVVYFISNSRLRREAFLGYTFNKTTRLFSYLSYNDYENKLYSGFRFDKKINFTNKVSLNNQFRYLSPLGIKSDNDIGVYIPDLLYNMKYISFGFRAFIINRIKNFKKIFVSKPFVGPTIVLKEDKFMTMISLLPDINQRSDDFLLMALFIFNF